MSSPSVIPPIPLGRSDVSRLRGLSTSGQEHENGRAILSEIDAIPGPKHKPGFPDSATDALVVAEIARLKAQDTGLNSGSHGNIEMR
jgi:hypothetical protein